MEIISVNEFAKRIGVDEKAVRRAIESGKISEGVELDQNGKKKIKYEIALKEAESTGLGKRSVYYEKSNNLISKPEPKIKKEQVVPPPPTKLFKGGYQPTDKLDTSNPPTKSNSKDDQEIHSDDLPDLDSGEIPPLKTSIKVKEYYSAKIRKLEAKEKEGELVKRDIVFTQLFEFHKQIKNNLLSIPDRITDDILHEENRDKVHRMIYDAIADELEKLSDVNNINLQDE